MKVDLVRVETADGMRLDGALSFGDSSFHATQNLPHGNPFDAVILLHGVGSNFYQPRLLQHLAEAYEAAGCWSLRVNTRGHDTIHTVGTTSGARRQGAALERVSDCLFDIDAWVKLLVERGRRNILLLGHSLGAIKAVYWAAMRSESHDVAALAALSPPRLSAAAFGASPAASEFLRSLEQAQRQVTTGNPEQLIEVTFPFPMPISAATYVDKYGGERYNIVELVGDIRVPTLFTYGEQELSHGPFVGLPETLNERRGDANSQVAVIDGADHSYSGCESAVLNGIGHRFHPS